MKLKKFIKENLVWIIMVPCVLLVDQLSKFFARKYLVGGKYIPLIGEFLGFTYTANDGAAWNMLSGNRFLLSLISIAACVAIAVYYFIEKHGKVSKFALSMIFAGALGNGIDRVLFGEVTDMINCNIFIIFNDYFPIFNVADLFVTFGAALFLIAIIFIEKENKENE